MDDDETNVLVLEDDTNLRELIVELLEDNGMSAIGACDAPEAVRICEDKNNAEFDVMVSDVRVPGPVVHEINVNGLCAVELVKKRIPRLRCVVITGYAHDSAPQKALDIEVDEYLYKPFHEEDLLSVVRTVRRADKDHNFFASLLNKHYESQLDSGVEHLEKARSSLLNAFRVTIRAKVLHVDIALHAWDIIEILEEKYLQFHEAEVERTPSNLAELAKNYRDTLSSLRMRLENHTMPRASMTRPSGKVSRPDFDRFFHRLLDGSVNTEELHMAAFLRLKQYSLKAFQDLNGRIWRK